ncbi:MAG: HD domain-containing phosphohydrolase [Verrucomicrobiota bacterium]|jgi:response regulator RpfG family c-di-GMP phosphodiesterase
MNDRILFVDDDPNLLASLERNLRNKFKLETATSGEAGLAKLTATNGAGPFAAVFSDRQMPNMDGIQFLSKVREQAPDTVRVMLTGNVDLEQAIRAVNEGNIFRFLIKPCPLDDLTKTVESALTQYRLITGERELLDKTLNGSIKLLTDILSMVDAKSFGQAEQLRDLITKVSQTTPLAKIWEIHLAAMLSPIGYVTLPSETLVKAREGSLLSKKEEQLLDSIPEITARLLANIPRLEGVARIARYQHKRFNGDGFPADAIRGQEIPLGARLLKILNDMLQIQARGSSRAQALDELSARLGWYDLELLASIRTGFGIAGEKPDNFKQAIAIEANNLTIGMLLTSDVYTKDNILILSAGHHLNATILERIRNFNLIHGIREPIYVKMPKF